MSAALPTRGFVFTFFLLAGVAVAQSDRKAQTVTINGHTGQVTTYQIEGRTYVDLETLMRIADGAISFRGSDIVLQLPAAVPDSYSSQEASGVALSQEFMRASLQTLTILKDWTNTLAYGIQHGVPGDGRRMVVFHDRSADALRLAKVAVSSQGDQEALQLLTNHFNMINGWSDKLVAERKRMDTGKYSITPDAIKNDETYQKIAACNKFLNVMLPGGTFQDDYACH
jgi:hypothetical protein